MQQDMLHHSMLLIGWGFKQSERILELLSMVRMSEHMNHNN